MLWWEPRKPVKNKKNKILVEFSTLFKNIFDTISKMPNYCIISDTTNLAREVLKHGEGMRILMSESSKILLDKAGGFRCEHGGALDMKVRGREK